MCCWLWTLCHTIQHRAVLIIFPFNLQTITITEMLSRGGDRWPHNRLQYFTQFNVLYTIDMLYVTVSFSLSSKTQTQDHCYIYKKPRLQFLPERDYVTFGSLLSQIRLSVICNVGAPYWGGWSFRQYFLTTVYLAIVWPSCKILRRSPLGNPSIGGIKRKRVSKIEWFWTYRRLYLINGTR